MHHRRNGRGGRAGQDASHGHLQCGWATLLLGGRHGSPRGGVIERGERAAAHDHHHLVEASKDLWLSVERGESDRTERLDEDSLVVRKLCDG